MADELPVPVHFRVAQQGIANSCAGRKSDVLFGWLHRPRGRFHGRTGVILCDPFGSEQNSIYRCYRQLAERLSSEGLWVMRFDYYGTGNSAGGDQEPGLVRAWLDSIHAAIETLTKTSGVEEIVLFGTRLGATLEVAAAAERSGRNIRGVALWSPFDSGGDFCREALFAKKLSARNSPAPSPGADLELTGFLLTASTMGDLRLVDLLAISQPPALRALVLARNAMLSERRLVNHLRSLGVETSHEFIPGLPKTLVAPDQGEIPVQVIDRVATWIRESNISEPVSEERRTDKTHPRGVDARPGLRPTVAVDDAVCETPLRFGRSGGLFGILSEPRHPPEAGTRLPIILINPGAAHHTGANRLHVEVARQCAAAGHPALRFDFSGLGDSPPAENSAANAVSMQEAVLEDERRGIVTKDIIDAMNALQDARGLDWFVLFGPCSAGRMAFHAAVRDTRVVGAQLINTPFFDVQHSVYPERAPDDGLTLDSQVLSQQETGRQAKAVEHPFGWQGNEDTEDPSHVARSPLNDICEDFVALSRRGVRPMLVYSPADVGIGYIEGLLSDTVNALGIGIEIVPGADHDFSDRTARVHLIGLLTEYLDKLEAA